MSEQNNIQLLTLKEAEGYLRVSATVIDNLRRSGDLKTVSVGRRLFFKKETLDNFINNQITPQED